MSATSPRQLRDMLRSSDLLRALPEHELDGLAARARRSRHPRGRLLFTKGDEGSGLMLVVSGRVKIVSVSPSGAEVILNIIEPGCVFGEMALLDGKPRSADAIVAADSEIVELSRKEFLHVLARNPEAAIEMMVILCGRLRQATSSFEDAVLLDSGTRLLHRLKTLAEQYGRRAADGSLRIDHGLSQQELGESVGLTRVSINRLLGQWREEGLVDGGRGYLVVRDFAKLEAAVEES